ncbi:MAG: methanogenesis marker 6 protein [Candidatus Altiarchaeales archaeon]|nr:MAG: methanogenesis marker 6 protein [Candidatus Altiarchaeales archaeon]
MAVETRLIVISPDSKVTPVQVVNRILRMPFNVVVKETCYGALVEGEPEALKKIVEEVRKLDPNGIFTKVRGFPVGDVRVCRATRRGGPRPGFHQLELEYSLLPYVRRALDKLEE